MSHEASHLQIKVLCIPYANTPSINCISRKWEVLVFKGKHWLSHFQTLSWMTKAKRFWISNALKIWTISLLSFESTVLRSRNFRRTFRESKLCSALDIDILFNLRGKWDWKPSDFSQVYLSILGFLTVWESDDDVRCLMAQFITSELIASIGLFLRNLLTCCLLRNRLSITREKFIFLSLSKASLYFLLCQDCQKFFQFDDSLKNVLFSGSIFDFSGRKSGE